MATREAIAERRARWIGERMGDAVVLDATSGIGVDSLALAALGVRVVAADRDPFHARCAAANLAHHGFVPRVVVADALAPAVRVDALVLDPQRRPEGRRTLDPERWSPALSAALRVAARARGACIKLAPALDVGSISLPPGPARWSFVSEARELCEVALWMGELADVPPGSGPRREVVALRGGAEVRYEAEPEQVAPVNPHQLEGLAWLADPDPALVRSGLLGALARREGLRPLDARSAYLGGERPPGSPLLQAWRVLGSAPLDVRRVRALLEQHDVGPLMVKKRGQAEPAEVLARRLAGRGARPGVLIVARTDAGHRAWLVEAAERSREPGGVGDEGFEPPTSSV